MSCSRIQLYSSVRAAPPLSKLPVQLLTSQWEQMDRLSSISRQRNATQRVWQPASPAASEHVLLPWRWLDGLSLCNIMCLSDFIFEPFLYSSRSTSKAAFSVFSKSSRYMTIWTCHHGTLKQCNYRSTALIKAASAAELATLRKYVPVGSAVLHHHKTSEC